MELKYLSGATVVAVLLLNIFGWFWSCAFVLGLLSLLTGMLMVLYLQHDTVDSILKPSGNALNNPLEQKRNTLGLDFDIAAKRPTLLIPNICEQTDRWRRRSGGGCVGTATAADHPPPMESLAKRRKSHAADTSMRKKSLIDSGIEMFFKKHAAQSSTASHQRLGSPTQVVADIAAEEAHHQHLPHQQHRLHQRPTHLHPEDRNKWRPFESIKIYTERRRSHDCGAATATTTTTASAAAATTATVASEALRATTGGDRKSDISIGEECFYTTMPFQQKTAGHHHHHHQHQPAATAATAAAEPVRTPPEQVHESSPRRHKPRSRTIFTGHKPIDQILHTMIDYVLRDYIDSWFSIVSDNTEFSAVRTRTSIEESVHNACARIKNTQWVPLITTKLADDLAAHTRIYRLAGQAVSQAASAEAARRQSPQKRGSAAAAPSGRKSDTLETPGLSGGSLRHRRNKSDTDLSWHTASGNSGTSSSSTSAASANSRNVANSKFYTESIDEQSLFGDAESRLTAAFFDISDTWRDECMDDKKLEEYLTHAAETILYFTIPEDDFACVPLRHFLAALLANVVCRPLLDMLADPDFINLQLARFVPAETINSDYFIKLTRQCTDLSELRACRQFVVREMDAKFKENNAGPELSSLLQTQKLIDLRLSYLQHSKTATSERSGGGSEPRSLSADMPQLTLEELLTKELALSYYLDYLSILNLQKYVIFYLTAMEWKAHATRCIQEIHSKVAGAAPRDTLLAELREKAAALHGEYLTAGSSNYLQVDRGLIEALHIKTSNLLIVPENTWFDSICKFVYEKLKNEDVFLAQFYQSAAYKKLLLELEFGGQSGDAGLDFDTSLAGLNFDTSSGDSNSADIPFEEDEELAALTGGISNSDDESIGGATQRSLHSLDVGTFKHSRSHSDCTGIFSDPLRAPAPVVTSVTPPAQSTRTEQPPRSHSPLPFHSGGGGSTQGTGQRPQRVCARIINTAILCEGQYAVYAIEVSVSMTADTPPSADAAGAAAEVKSWHVYRRYSKFLELKKALVKRSAAMARIPFPAKKTFQNTDRAVLEHRMVVLNEFLRLVCQRAEDNADVHAVVRDFMEPDTNDRKMHGGAVVKTIETIVNPIKSGMRTIKNMPDTLVGGIAKILLGRGPMKQSSFLDVMPAIEHSWDYPALTSALNLLDEVFDLQARSQWLRRGIINRLLGAPWVSHATNKKIIQATKSAIGPERIESIAAAILNSIWPDGGRHRKAAGREDNTKLRTRMAAKIALLSLLADDLKHVVGSETTRSGLLSLLAMLQNRRLNRRLALVIFNHVLTTVLQVDSLTKHAR